MAKTTIVTGILLMVLGVGFYLAASERSLTALIPSIIGLPIFALGLVAQNELRRKHAMHAAAVFGLLGFLGSLRGAKKWPALLSGQPVTLPLAAWEMLALAIICGVFLILCVRSFKAARQAR